MATAGTVTVDFAAETARFTQELKKVRADLRGLKEDTSSISKSIGTVGKSLLGFISVGAVIAGIRSVVKATVEEQAAIAQLESALKTAGAQVGLTSKDFTAFAAELQKTTTFADDAIISVQSILLSFRGLSGGVIQDATRAVLDLSSRLGTDLNSAAKLVGRALADPEKGLTALTRAGVQFSEAQKDVIKALITSGKTVEAQNLILKELEGRYGGAAVAARNTLGGALAGLKNSFGDLLEAKNGAPGLTLAINALSDMLQSSETRKGFEVLTQFLAGVISLGAGALRVLGFIGDAASFIANLGKDELVGRVDGLVDKIKQLNIELSRTPDNIPALEQQRLLILKQIVEAQAELDRLIGSKRVPGRPDRTATAISQEQLDLLQPVSVSVRKLDTFPLENRLLESERRAAALKLEAETLEQINNEILENRGKAVQESISRDLAAYSEYTADRVAQEQQLAAQTTALRQGAVNSAIGLLQVLSTRSKSAAIALILVNRGLMIAQTIQNTAAAAAKALAIYGPTPQGFAAAAAAKVFGAIQIGLIAATGALEIGQVSKGNSAAVVGPGTINNPIRTDEVNQGAGGTAATVRERPIATVNVFGWSEQAIRELVERIRETSADYDLRIIRNP